MPKQKDVEKEYQPFIEKVIDRLKKLVDRSPLSRDELSRKCGVSLRSLVSWINDPFTSRISLVNFIILCMKLGKDPSVILDGAEMEYIDKYSDPVGSESALLELERNIPKNRNKYVLFPFVTSVLQNPAVTKMFLHHGTYKIYDDDDYPITIPNDKQKLIEKRKIKGKKEFLETRAKRKEIFCNAMYTHLAIVMWREFEYFLNADQIYKYLTIDKEDPRFVSPKKEDLFWKNHAHAVSDQLDDLLALLDIQWDGKPRLDIRMTKNQFRIQYGVYEQDDESVLIVNTNLGYLKIVNPAIETFLKNEFTAYWNESVSTLTTNDDWKTFLKLIRDEFEEAVEKNKRPQRINLNDKILELLDQ